MTTIAVHGYGLRRGPRLARAAMLAAGTLTVISAVIHLHLWFDGYRRIPDIGPLFLGQAVVGIGIGVATVAVRRRIIAMAGVLHLAATSMGLLLSATIGVFNFHDGLDAPYAGLSLAVQGAGIAFFMLAAVIRVQAEEGSVSWR